MPTYEYECTSCKHAFEKFQKMNDKRLDTCPKCGQKVKRLIGSGAGIIFKGSGFYATDYRKGSNSEKSAKSDSPACQQDKDGCKSCPHAR